MLAELGTPPLLLICMMKKAAHPEDGKFEKV